MPHVVAVDERLDARIRARFPFPLTGAQDRCVGEIAEDLAASLAALGDKADVAAMNDTSSSVADKIEPHAGGTRQRQSPGVLYAEAREIEKQIAEAFAESAIAVAEEMGMGIEHVDLIGSHGQTLWHAVRDDGSVAEDPPAREQQWPRLVHAFTPRSLIADGQHSGPVGLIHFLP